MNALELTQRQRELLGNIAEAANQYRQAMAEASARLERENAQIEQSRLQERQRIEEEREQKTKVTFKKPAKDEQEQKRREELLQGVRREIAAERSKTTPPRGITTIEAVKGEINALLSTENGVGSPPMGRSKTLMFILGSIALVSLCGLTGICSNSPEERTFGWCYLLTFILSLVISVLSEAERRRRETALVALVNRIVLLHGLYDRWLELVDEQAGARRVEAQRRYDQAFAQAKGQVLAAAEQLRPAIAEFGALTERVYPSWESEAWRQWEPGRVGPGTVRLGTFKKVEV